MNEFRMNIGVKTTLGTDSLNVFSGQFTSVTASPVDLAQEAPSSG